MASPPWPPPPPPLARANAIVGETKPMDATANNAITVVVLQPGEAALARIAQAAQPKGTPQLGEVHPVRRPLLSASAGNPHATLCVQRRLACSAGDKPAGVPVVWIAEVMETETLKPIDKVSPGEATSHRAVTKVNVLWPRK